MFNGCAEFSVIKTDDLEWFFFSLQDFKNSNNNRTNRATQSGYWKVTGKDRKIKARGTNNVFGTKKTLVFYRGRVRGGVRTNWVMHEYHPTVTLPHQVGVFHDNALNLVHMKMVDDAQIVSRMRSSRPKSSSLILILEIAKEELSCTGVVPATESPMPKSE